MMSDCISLHGKILGRLILPPPFHELETVWDSRAKGSWIIVHVSNDFDVSVFKCRPGIRILDSTTYNSHNSMTFIQCPNVTKKSVGFIAIGIEKKQQSTKNEFTKLKDGIINRHAFMCIVQGVFLSPLGELSYIYHKLQNSSIIRTSLQYLIQKKCTRINKIL